MIERATPDDVATLTRKVREKSGWLAVLWVAVGALNLDHLGESVVDHSWWPAAYFAFFTVVGFTLAIQEARDWWPYSRTEG